MNTKSKVGFYTTWNVGRENKCWWYGCNKDKIKGTCFCEEHGKIKVKGIIR